jgi:serine/threonine-protein kinase
MWAGKDDVVVLHQLTTGAYPASPKEVEPSVPDAVDAICRRALAFKPEDRYSTAAEMHADLDRVIHELRRSADAAQRQANQELADYVVALFADERQEMQTKIEQQMKALSEATHPELIEAVQITRRKVTPSTDHDAPTELHQASQPERSGSTDAQMLALAIAVIALGAAAWAIRASGDGGVAAPTPSSPVEEEATGTASERPSAEAEDSVRVQLSATPSDAVLTLDGRRLAQNPFQARFDRDERLHELTIEAPGHDPLLRTIVFDRDLSLHFELVQTDKTGKTARPPRPAPPQPGPQPSAKGVDIKATRSIDTSDPYKKSPQSP